MIFKLEETKKFLKRITELGNTVTFNQFGGKKEFLIRHDIDLDLRLARDFAIIENELGIKATYFILTGCATYNVLNKKNRDYLIEIKNLGHEIGLHFDPTLYNENTFKYYADFESNILENIIGEKIHSISLHNPSLHGQYPEIEGYHNAYSTKFFNPEFYLSDSRYSFRNKNPFEFLEKISESHLQILLHPLHYTHEGSGYDAVMQNWFIGFAQEIELSFKGNQTFENQVQDGIIHLIKSNNNQ